MILQVLTTFLKGLLEGGSSPAQELASKGYKVLYVQDPRDEYDFAVDNLAIDLRNGLRLCKAAEALSGELDNQAKRRAATYVYCSLVYRRSTAIE